MTLRLVPAAQSPFLATAVALTRAQADQWRHESALSRPFRVLVNGELVPFESRVLAKLFAEFWKGELLP